MTYKIYMKGIKTKMKSKEPMIYNGRKVYTTKVESAYRKFYYRHFKSQPSKDGVCRGKWYKALMIAQGSEDKELYMVYQALYGNGEIYIRPLEMFLSDVDKNKYPESKEDKRFTSWDELVEKHGLDEAENMFFNEVYGE